MLLLMIKTKRQTSELAQIGCQRQIARVGLGSGRFLLLKQFEELLSSFLYCFITSVELSIISFV
jgi:hypothetical protein